MHPYCKFATDSFWKANAGKQTTFSRPGLEEHRTFSANQSVHTVKGQTRALYFSFMRHSATSSTEVSASFSNQCMHFVLWLSLSEIDDLRLDRDWKRNALWTIPFAA